MGGLSVVRTTQQETLSTPSETSAVRSANVLAFQVEDMTCGHCAGSIKQVIESALPGTRVDADPASKLVTVHGGGDYSTIRSIVTGIGYTPSAEPALP